MELASVRPRRFESLLGGLFFLCALISVLVSVAVIAVLLVESVHFFEEVSPLEFLFGTEWSPIIEPKSYGVLPLVIGTLMIVLGAGLVALPVGLAIAIYLSEYAGAPRRRIIKPLLEVLAGVPTVVYGYFALIVVTPALRSIFPETEIFNAASAAIVVGIMILPMVASLCDDALRTVPGSLRDAAYALGATPLEVNTRIVLPGALSGVFAAFVLAIARAMGETMAVTLAAGATPTMDWQPLQSIQAMTGYMIQVSLGDNPSGSLIYHSLFAVAGVLFFTTLVLNLIAQKVMRQMREVYQ
ncbi:MAG: phosphate ABC transporter permease subunit PstC [Pseudomonadales bacterium]